MHCVSAKAASAAKKQKPATAGSDVKAAVWVQSNSQYKLLILLQFAFSYFCYCPQSCPQAMPA